MAFPLCDRCRKRLYPSQDRAFSAALSSSRLFGMPFRVYPCPKDVTRFHVTKRP